MGIHEPYILQKKSHMKRIKRKKYIEKELKIIGVIGAGPAVGVTHLCILMANYFCSACGEKTAVLERNDHGDFACFGSVCTGMGKAEECYQIQEADYYPEADERRLAWCLKEGYQKIIMDFGTMEKQDSMELLRCHKVYFILSFSEWQEGAFGSQKAWQEQALEDGWQCLAAFGSEESRIQWNKRRRPAVLRIPFSVDAFTITKNEIDWMKQLM